MRLLHKYTPIYHFILLHTNEQNIWKEKIRKLFIKNWCCYKKNWIIKQKNNKRNTKYILNNKKHYWSRLKICIYWHWWNKICGITISQLLQKSFPKYWWFKYFIFFIFSFIVFKKPVQFLYKYFQLHRFHSIRWSNIYHSRNNTLFFIFNTFFFKSRFLRSFFKLQVYFL